MEFKGTSAPWHAVEYAGTIAIQDVAYYGGNDILNMEYFDREVVEANGKLIERSPQMFDAISKSLQNLTDLSENMKKSNIPTGGIDEVIADLKAAVYGLT